MLEAQVIVTSVCLVYALALLALYLTSIHAGTDADQLGTFGKGLSLTTR